MTTPLTFDRLSQARVQATATDAALASADQAKIHDLASQFESLLISQMMKDLQSSMVGDEHTDGFDVSPLGDAMNSELGLSLSRAGGFGLGDALAGAMARQAKPGKTEAS